MLLVRISTFGVVETTLAISTVAATTWGLVGAANIVAARRGVARRVIAKRFITRRGVIVSIATRRILKIKLNGASDITRRRIVSTAIGNWGLCEAKLNVSLRI